MRLGKVLKYALIGIPLIAVIVVVAAIALLMTIDFNEYKPLIAEETKKAIGRDLVIAGDLELDISLTPAVSVAGVTLSNASWGERPEMVKVERFEAQISLIPILFGVIDIRRVVLIGADIVLEVDSKGRANFAFAPPEPAVAGKPEAAEPAEAEELMIPIGVREVVIERSRIAYSDARAGSRYDVAIDRLTLRGDGLDAPIELLYEGSYNDAPLELSGTLGSPNDLMAGRPLPVEANLKAGGAVVSITGRIEEPAAAKGLDLALAINGKQFGDLSALAGTAMPKLGPYDLSMRVTGDPATAVNLRGLTATLAGNDIAGNVTIKLAGKRPVIDATLASHMIDLAAIAGAAGGTGKPSGDQAPPAAAGAERIFPDDPLPLDGLRAVDARLRYTAKTIVAAGARLENAELGLSLTNGNLSVKPLKAAIADGAIDGSIQLDGRKKAAGLVLKTSMRRVDLNRLLSELGVTKDVEGRADIGIDVSGNGVSVRQLMGSLDGRAGLLMGKGRMKDTFLQSMLGGSGQLMNQVLDRGQRGYTIVECGVADFKITNGVAAVRALYLDIDPRGVIGSGSIDLGNETLDLLVDPRKKRSMNKPVLPMRIKGSFTAPQYSIDRAVAAQKLGKALGIELPPGVGGGTEQAGVPVVEGPCAPPVSPAATSPPAEQAPASPAPSQPQDVLKDAEQQLKKGLKGLFGQ